VRNLFFRKIALFHGNGITIDADALITGNVVENAPGFGILVGHDARDASIVKNDIRNAHIGIGIPAAIAKTVLIAENRISSVRDGAIRTMSGPTPVGPDLADRYATS
jgi:putative cofactor-binding repeat protein